MAVFQRIRYFVLIWVSVACWVKKCAPTAKHKYQWREERGALDGCFFFKSLKTKSTLFYEARYVIATLWTNHMEELTLCILLYT